MRASADSSNLYLIDVPPPTISGALHMGHVFSYCQMDFVARFQRYLGKDLVYPFCFDCNGLPTEKLASKNGIREPEEIVKFAEQKSQEYANHFQTQRMGWSEHRYHTFSPQAVKLVQLSFQDLVDKKLAYKAHRKFWWCPGCYERSGAKVEERSGEGWFVDILNHLPRIRDAIDQIKWHPDVFRERLHAWLDQVNQDWSISRERNFGISIPGETGIVFDTWFTSSLTPQLAWTSKLGAVSLQCPVFDARFQAHDIIRTWALFTIIRSLYHNNQVPWRHIVVSGHALDKRAQKMSKTAGNAAPPSSFFDQYGAYGVRFWAGQSQLGTDTSIDPLTMNKGRKLANKIRNARRFLKMSATEGDNVLWLESWNAVKSDIVAKCEAFAFPDALSSLVAFFWGIFCDLWIEASKKSPANRTLDTVLTDMIDLFEIWLPGIEQEADSVEVPL